MKLAKELLRIDSGLIQNKITRFIRDYVGKAGKKGVVLGLSGGVDSATAIALSRIALRQKQVIGLYMPEEETRNRTDQRHVSLLSRQFSFHLKALDITKVLDSLYKCIPDYSHEDTLSRGNLKARVRAAILYYYANHHNLIVVGSSDKSEAMIGYYTKWGDAAADIAPIMDLFKTQVRQLASHLDVPQAIVNKPSTPALWPNQTAESEIGLKYEVLDLILYGLERFMSPETIAEQLKLQPGRVNDIRSRWLQSEHKRQMPLTTKLGYRTVGADFRLTRSANEKPVK